MPGGHRQGVLLAAVGFVFLLPDHRLDAGAELVFQDSFENHDPVITSTPVTAGTAGITYSYDVDATDIDGDTLLYLLTTTPASRPGARP